MNGDDFLSIQEIKYTIKGITRDTMQNEFLPFPFHAYITTKAEHIIDSLRV